MADDNTFFFKLVIFLVLFGTIISLLTTPSFIPPSASNFTINTASISVPASCQNPTDIIASIGCLVWAIVIAIIWFCATLWNLGVMIVSSVLYFSGLGTIFNANTANVPEPLFSLIKIFLVFAWIYAAALFVKTIRQMGW